MINVFIVDDESLVRKGLRQVIPWRQYDMHIVGEAANGDKALQALENLDVHLLFTDITMPGMSGLELMANVNERFPGIEMVVLTCHQDFYYIQEAMRIGAIDYIVKTQLDDLNIDELMTRIAKRVTGPANQTFSNAMKENDPGIKWGSLSWVEDDGAFQRRLKELVRINASERERCLIQALRDWSERLPAYSLWFYGYKDHMHLEEIKAWFETLRMDLKQWLRKPGYSEDVLQAIIRAVDMMNEWPISELSQSGIIREINISKSYFSKSFKEIVRESFVGYMQNLSIRQARKLLQETNHPIYWIAESCGFQDERYFSKVFREKTGQLPSEFRLNRHE